MQTVLLVAAEAAPFVKTGGLGDVMGSLPKALRTIGIDARVMLPKYQSIAHEHQAKMKLLHEFTVPLGWRRQYCGLHALEYNDIPFYFLDNGQYFQRPYMYGYYDEAERYAYFCRAVLEALPFIGAMPQIIHCHDWQTGLISVLLDAHFRSQPSYQAIRTMFTIHNLKYQGVFPKEIMGDIVDLGWEYFTADRIEFHDRVNFMKGGLSYSDLITTVSPTYASEIQMGFYGEQLDGFIHKRRDSLHGIVNGIDYELYNPETDPHIFCRYNAYCPKKHENKEQLQQMLGLPVDTQKPMLAIVSRLVSQKGLDLIARVIHEILAMDVQLVVLGTGEGQFEGLFRYAAHCYPAKVSVHTYFDEAMARRIYAASDMLLMPSLFEPCGLAQLIAMRYGCIPVVRETGGLRDTVLPYNEHTVEGNGFSFTNYNAHDMLYTIRRAVTFYNKPEIWSGIVATAMNADYSWRKSAQQYSNLYGVLSPKEAVYGAQ
jgi:starch synthase